ncbi:MAG: S-adenosylmethionine decarboxylase [Bryobacteraceae bacterium]
MTMGGLEWLVEAYDCNPAPLAEVAPMERFLQELIEALPLHPVADPVWHRFGGHGGITGLCLLSESHFACHTFPEHRSLTLNLFCCRPRPDFDFEGRLAAIFEARRVTVRKLARDYA